MNKRQKNWITRTLKTIEGMDRQKRAMEISFLALKLYSNIKWPTWEIVEVEEYLLKLKP